MLFVLIVIFLIGYWVGKSGSNQTAAPQQTYWLQRIIDALVYSAQNEIKKARSKTTKDALQRVIDAGYQEQYGYVPGSDKAPEYQTENAVAQTRATAAPTPVSAAAEQPKQYIQGPNLVQQTPAKQDLDNTSLLLYFGAFLFIKKHDHT